MSLVADEMSRLSRGFWHGFAVAKAPPRLKAKANFNLDTSILRTYYCEPLYDCRTLFPQRSSKERSLFTRIGLTRHSRTFKKPITHHSDQFGTSAVLNAQHHPRVPNVRNARGTLINNIHTLGNLC